MKVNKACDSLPGGFGIELSSFADVWWEPCRRIWTFEGASSVAPPGVSKDEVQEGVSCYALKQVARSRADAFGVSGGV